MRKKIYFSLNFQTFLCLYYNKQIDTYNAMLANSREMFLYLEEDIAVQYYACTKQNNKKYFDNNFKLRGYKDLIDFYSIGLGWTFAMAKTKD